MLALQRRSPDPPGIQIRFSVARPPYASTLTAWVPLQGEPAVACRWRQRRRRERRRIQTPIPTETAGQKRLRSSTQETPHFLASLRELTLANIRIQLEAEAATPSVIRLCGFFFVSSHPAFSRCDYIQQQQRPSRLPRV